MSNDWKISYDQMFLLFGFLLFVLGTLGFIQIGLLEGLSELIPSSLIILQRSSATITQKEAYYK